MSALPDGPQVCSCNNVTKSDICSKIRQDGLGTVADVKSCTSAGTGCGGCLPMVTDLLDAELAAQGLSVRKRLCEHFDYARQELFDLIRVKQIASFGELISRHGSGSGCEVCKPTAASCFASLYNDMILDQHATLQDTNDRFLANSQRQGLYSVVPRIPGGEITPDKLIILGQIAKSTATTRTTRCSTSSSEDSAARRTGRRSREELLAAHGRMPERRELQLREQNDLSAVERFSQYHDSCDTPLQEKYYRNLIPASPPGPDQQYAFEVDLDKCSGCKACVTACHNLNGLDDGETWRSVGLLHGGEPEAPVQKTVTTACHHCLEPACMSGCPVKAYEKDPHTGIVKHLDDQCIGCQYCIFTCP